MLADINQRTRGSYRDIDHSNDIVIEALKSTRRVEVADLAKMFVFQVNVRTIHLLSGLSEIADHPDIDTRLTEWQVYYTLHRQFSRQHNRTSQISNMPNSRRTHCSTQASTQAQLGSWDVEIRKCANRIHSIFNPQLCITLRQINHSFDMAASHKIRKNWE
jgi:hypothetical protein